MTQAKKDQDFVNEAVEALARRFGPKRVMTALHTYAIKQTNRNPGSNGEEWARLSAVLEEWDYVFGATDFPAPR